MNSKYLAQFWAENPLKEGANSCGDPSCDHCGHENREGVPYGYVEWLEGKLEGVTASQEKWREAARSLLS